MQNFTIKCVDDYNKINLNKLTLWMYNWWGKEECWSKEKIKYYLQHAFNKNKLPKTIIAFNANNEEIGMCQILVNDLECRPDIYPCIANLYIDELYRKNGLVALLLNTALEELKKLNFKNVYLYTTHKNLYEKYGWQFVGNIKTYLNPDLQRLYKFTIN